MIEVVRTINKEYFDSIEINIIVDDLEIIENSSNDFKVTLLVTNNADNQITNHFVKQNKYEVSFEINNRVLHVYYFKSDMISLDETDYIEIIGCNLEIPNKVPYKIIENEKD